MAKWEIDPSELQMSNHLEPVRQAVAANYLVELGKAQIRNDSRFEGMSEKQIDAVVEMFFADRGPGATTDWNEYLNQTDEFLTSRSTTVRRTPDAAGGMRRRVRELQTMLKNAGFFAGPIDNGAYTEETATALANFRADALANDGTFSVGTDRWMNAGEIALLQAWDKQTVTTDETEEWLATPEAARFLSVTPAPAAAEEVYEWLDTPEARRFLNLESKELEEARETADTLEAIAADAQATADELDDGEDKDNAQIIADETRQNADDAQSDVVAQAEMDETVVSDPSSEYEGDFADQLFEDFEEAGGGDTDVIPPVDYSDDQDLGGDTTDPSSTSGYGLWIGDSDDVIHPSDFVDTDNDSVDDRWQAGPGEPDSRDASPIIAPGDSSAPTVDPLAEVKSRFISALAIVGIGAEFASDLWEAAATQFTEDITYTETQAVLDIYDQQAFKDRFPGIAQMRATGTVDSPARGIPTPGEYLRRESMLYQKFVEYGMDPANTDFDKLIGDLYANNVGDAEIVQRLDTAKRLVGSTVPDAIRLQFLLWYGPERAEENLMKTFLDPTDEWGGSWQETSEKVTSAEIGYRWSKVMSNLDGLGKSVAESITQLGYDQETAWRGFESIKQDEGLYIERLGEADLDPARHGIEAEFDVDTVSEYTQDQIVDLLNRRRNERISEFRGGGGAMVTQQGTGLGAAR